MNGPTVAVRDGAVPRLLSAAFHGLSVARPERRLRWCLGSDHPRRRCPFLNHSNRLSSISLTLLIVKLSIWLVDIRGTEEFGLSWK